MPALLRLERINSARRLLIRQAMEKDTARKYFDRYSAGRALAREVRRYLGDRRNIIVAALPPGGVPVGFAVAQELHAPLEILSVRRLPVPGYRDLVFGAIAPDGVLVIDTGTVRRHRLSDEVIKVIELQEQHELERRERTLRAARPRLNLRGKTVVLVDDGMTTGASMQAALQWVMQEKVDHCIVAAPVASAAACARFTQMPGCETCICRRIPDPFHTVGSWYENYPHLSDAMVSGLLQRAANENSLAPGFLRRAS